MEPPKNESMKAPIPLLNRPNLNRQLHTYAAMQISPSSAFQLKSTIMSIAPGFKPAQPFLFGDLHCTDLGHHLLQRSVF